MYRALLRPSSLHHFETRVRVRSLEDRRRSTRLDALKGILAKSGRVKEEEAARTFITTAAETKGKSRTPTKISAGEAKEATTPGGVEVEGNTSGAKPKQPLVTGVYRERLFIYDVDTRMRTQEWMENYCEGGAYYRAVQLMWMSGRHDWTRGKPCPHCIIGANNIRTIKRRKCKNGHILPRPVRLLLRVPSLQ